MSVHQLEVAAGDAGSQLAAGVQRDGSAAHAYPYSGALDRDRLATANLADLVHNLCVLHGRHPGIIDLAAERAHRSPAAGWLDHAAAAFGRERTLLAMLAAAAGPIPSTPGEAESSAAILTSRHALETLAGSDRAGCAAGAVAALLLDWIAIRRVLDRAAERLGVTSPRSALPSQEETLAALASVAVAPGPERALRFGAQQLLFQQRAFWDLMEARRSARTIA